MGRKETIQTNQTKARNRQEVMRHDIWSIPLTTSGQFLFIKHLVEYTSIWLFLHCPPGRYLVNLFIDDYLLKGLYGLLQIILGLTVRLMGRGGHDPYSPNTSL